MMRVRRRSGFTLVEVLISVVILGIGLIALSQLYFASMYTYQKAHLLNLAAQRAQRELELSQNFTFTLINTSLSKAANSLATDAYTGIPGSYVNYTDTRGYYGVKFPVSELPNGQGSVVFYKYNGPGAPAGGYPNLIKVDVNIYWSSQGPNTSFASAVYKGTESPIHVSTLIANK